MAKPLLCLKIFSIPAGKPYVLCSAEDIKERFGFFQRKSARQYILFASREIAKRNKVGTQITVELDDMPFVVHCFSRADKLAATLVSERDYPQRVAFQILRSTLTEFAKSGFVDWNKVAQDINIPFDILGKKLQEGQKAQDVDQLVKVKNSIDEAHTAVRANVALLLERDVKMQDLVKKSDDMDAATKLFVSDATRLNKCCRRWRK